MSDYKTLRECYQEALSENLIEIREAWSSAARMAAAAARGARGQGKAASRMAGRIAYAKAGGSNKVSSTGKPIVSPHRTEYAARNQLKHFRDAGITRTYFKDPGGNLHIYDSKTNAWTMGKKRTNFKRSTKAQAAQRQRGSLYD
jgi:hypothetical protein